MLLKSKKKKKTFLIQALPLQTQRCMYNRYNSEVTAVETMIRLIRIMRVSLQQGFSKCGADTLGDGHEKGDSGLVCGVSTA